MKKTLEELQAAFDATEDAFRLAADAKNAARKELDAAKLEATGLAGHLVEYNTYRRRGSKQRFVVDRILWAGTVGGRSVKADGSTGARDHYHRIDSLTDLGVYDPATAAALTKSEG